MSNTKNGGNGMPPMRTFSICLSDIPKDKIRKADNGKMYVNLTMFDNDEVDRFGNHFSVQISKTKEEREAKAKAVYVGNGKDWSREGDSKMEVPSGNVLPF
jgi:hypothetical protein|tara:strand:- start:956 stop:1258 length:303 start_codon:yes stop_codon:yes gene_type:complete